MRTVIRHLKGTSGVSGAWRPLTLRCFPSAVIMRSASRVQRGGKLRKTGTHLDAPGRGSRLLPNSSHTQGTSVHIGHLRSPTLRLTLALGAPGTPQRGKIP